MNTKAVAFGLVIALVLTVGTVSALSNSGGGDWEYYKEIGIKENSGTNLSSYPVLVALEHSNFPDKAKSDGSDLRFTEDGKELSYWVEEYNVSAGTVRIWVNVSSIPANGEAKVTMYYGNPDASAVSDGNATFVFFDDFSGTTLDVNKWYEDAVNNIDQTINNYFRFEDATKGGGYPHPYWVYDGTDTGSQHQAKWTPLNSFIVEWNSKISNTAASENGEGGVAIITTDNTIIYYAGHTDPWGGGIDTRRTVTDEKSDSYALNVNSGDEAKFSIAKDGDNYTAIINGIVVDNYTSSAQVSKIALTAGAAGNPFVDYVQVNDFRVRKYTSLEPTISLSQEFPNDYGLVAEWHFDEGSGNVTADSSGNGNDGIRYGATWTTGISGKALRFDGKDDYVNSSLNTDLTGNLTVEFWMKNTNLTSYQQRIVDLGRYSSTGFQLCEWIDGSIIIDNTGGPSDNVKTQEPCNDGYWHHVVGVREGNEYRLYVDGTYINSITGTIPLYDYVFIGRRAFIGDAYYFNGTIDEIRIYNRTLTATEIKTHYEEEKPTEELSTKEKIVFTSDRSGNSDIWMMDPDGTNLEQLTTNSSSDTSPQISPDGTKIAFLSDRTGSWQVWLMNTDGSNHYQLFDVNELPIQYEYEKRVNYPTWAPDGSYLITHIELVGEVNSAPWAAIYRHDPDGLNPQLFLDWGPSINGKFSISNDGRKFAYCREDSSYWTPTLKISVGNIVEGVVDETSINNLNVTIDGLVDEDVVWSSNGNKLMWSKSNNSEGYGIPQNLYSMNIDENDIKNLTTFTDKYVRMPDFAPDEQKVAFTVSNETTAGIYTMNANGSGAQALLVDDYKNSDPCWGNVAVTALVLFDTGEGTYPSISGTHNGTIKPSHNFTVNRMYTYPCAGTGGHTESIDLYKSGILIANGTWNRYSEDNQNVTLHNVTGASYVTLLKGHEYNYTIRTGSYPQIIHKQSHTTLDGSVITCTEFIDVNGKRYDDWIPAICLTYSAEGGDFELTILHTSDVHAHIDDFDVDQHGNRCDVEDKAEGRCFGGVARRKTMIDQIRNDSGNVVLLDAGDQFQGTLFYNLYKGAAAQEMMNRLGYDAMAVGNHEFDDGPSTLARFIDGANFPVLSANINASAEPALAGKILPYTILEVDGERIGVVGYTTEDTVNTSSPGPNVTFNTIEAILPPVIDELEAMGINKIIALSHAGFGRDCQVASTVSGLDVIVGGHSHTLLSNTDPDAEGPYPVVVNASDGNPVLVVTDFSWGKNLGRLNVTFNAIGVVINYSGNPILLGRGVVKDPEIQARVMELAEPLEKLKAKVIGSTIVDLNATNCRFVECTMGNLITDAMLWKTQNGGTQIAIVQGGGIRASIPAGNVTVGDILTVLPFGNLISTFELTGAEIVEALENGVSRADNPENEGTGRFPQVSGMRYSWSPTHPVGSRIISADIRNPHGSYISIDLNATYKLASTGFLRKGGDGYDVFVRARNAYDFGPVLSDAVQEYITAFSPVAPLIEGRIIPV